MFLTSSTESSLSTLIVLVAIIFSSAGTAGAFIDDDVDGILKSLSPIDTFVCKYLINVNFEMLQFQSPYCVLYFGGFLCIKMHKHKQNKYEFSSYVMGAFSK